MSDLKEYAAGLVKQFGHTATAIRAGTSSSGCATRAKS